jgi:tetratricopeptide (TPR) repeat protein
MVFGVLMLLAIAPAPWAVQSGTAAYLRTARPADVLYESQTLYSLASVKQVSQRPDTRVLSLDKNEQGTVLPGDATYIQGFPAAVGAAVLHGLFPLGSSPAILFLGSGGYVLPRYAGTVWPQSHIRVVEPDPGVTAAATIGLGLGSTMAETIRLDAGTYVSTAQVQRKRGGSVGRCDLVYAQFSNPFDVPFYLLTKQFDDKLSLLLSEKGVYVLSIADTAEGGRFLSAVVNTLEQTFLSVQVVARAVDRPAAVESFVVIAGPRPLNLTEMLTSDSACPPVRVLDAAATDQLKNRSAGLVLMDERAPVGTLLAPVVRADASLRLARKRFHQAVLLEGQGQGELCDVLYGQAAAADTPIQVDAYAAIGRRYLTQGDINKAGEAFGAALKCAIEHGAAVMTTAEIHAELAGVLRKINLLPQAKQHMAAAIKGFQTEVRWHPKSVVAWEHMGDAFVFQDDWSSASDVFSRCVELEPDYLTHYDKLAKALEMQHRYGEAAKTVRAQIVILKKTGRKEAADQQTHIAEYLEYQQAKQRG